MWREARGEDLANERSYADTQSSSPTTRLLHRRSQGDAQVLPLSEGVSRGNTSPVSHVPTRARNQESEHSLYRIHARNLPRCSRKSNQRFESTVQRSRDRGCLSSVARNRTKPTRTRTMLSDTRRNSTRDRSEFSPGRLLAILQSSWACRMSSCTSPLAPRPSLSSVAFFPCSGNSRFARASFPHRTATRMPRAPDREYIVRPPRSAR